MPHKSHSKHNETKSPKNSNHFNEHHPNPPSDIDFDITVANCPPTKRVPAIHADEYIQKPGIARGNLAASTDSPHGDEEYSKKHRNFTPLQQHVLFWDRDADGQIYPWDTYIGFRELGFNILFSFVAVLIININFSYPTRLAHSYIPDPWFRVYVDSIHKAKHGSDSSTYDPEGRLVPQSFENMFSKYNKNEDGTLTFGELFTMIKGHRCAADPFGWGAAFFEWGSTWLLIQRDGKIYKEDVRAVMDGSIFWRIREERQKTRQGWNKGWGIGGDGFVGSQKVHI
ncbi:caleosin family protein [Aspergillus ruber CBS 135680]|uniref:Caleosin domain protein n=1 Tax=Aspergillus ruber (strain CBS 135680) TaxID=1388766 RepID=A0A017SG82_ASPRC|nr:caleosin domain protein [Aspergillus ruber CBS 135680]EYE95639.1 caleosin domain protein [Aspergillus ruber CBS 135680]